MIRVAGQSPDAGPGADKFRGFNPDDYQNGDHVSYFYDGEWRLGQVEKIYPNDVAINNGKIEINIYDLVLGLRSVQLDVTPHKFDRPMHSSVNLNGAVYDWDNLHTGSNGEVLVDLIPSSLVGPTGQPIKERHDVNIEVLHGAQAIENSDHALISMVYDLANRARRAAGAQAEQLVGRLTELRKKAAELPSHLGAVEHWELMSPQKAAAVGEKVRTLLNEVKSDLDKLEKEIVRIEQAAVEASGNQAKSHLANKIFRVLERNLEPGDKAAKADPAWQEWENYDVELAAWEKDKTDFAADPNNKGKKFPDKEPSKPRSKRPTLPSAGQEARRGAMGLIYQGIQASNDPEVMLLRDEINAEVDKRRQKHYQDNVMDSGTDYAASSAEHLQVSAEILAELMAEWQALPTAGAESKVFNFDQEKDWLEAKRKELEDKAKTLADLDSQRNTLTVLSIAGRDIAALVPTDTNIKDHILAERSYLGNIELGIEAQLHGERKLAEVSPTLALEEKREEFLDLSGRDLVEIMEQKGPEMQELLMMLYDKELNGEQPDAEIVIKLKKLFDSPPANGLTSILNRLRGCGIRDWEHLKSLVEQNAPKMVAALHRMAQEQLARQVNLKSGLIGKILAQGRHYGVRVLTTMLLVGGGALAFKFVIPAAAFVWLGSLVGVGGGSAALGAGGLVGGSIRAWLQRTVFGTDQAKAKQQAALAKHAGRIRAKLVHELERTLFTSGNIDQTNQVFSALLSQTLNEAVVEENTSIRQAKAENKDMAAGLSQEQAVKIRAEHQALDKQGQQLYLASLEALRQQEGVEPDFKQKLDLMVAVAKMKEIVQERAAQGANGGAEVKLPISDRIKNAIVDGIAKGYTGGFATKEAGWVGVALTMFAGLGAALALSSAEGRFMFAGAGGAVSGLMEADRKLELKSEKAAERLLQAKLQDFDYAIRAVETVGPGPTSLPSALANLRELYAEFKVILGGKEAGQVANEDLVAYIRSYEIVRAEVYDRFNQAQRLLLRAGHDQMIALGDEAERQSQLKTSWFAKKAKALGRSAHRIYSGTWRGILFGGVAVLAGEFITPKAAHASQLVREKLGLAPTPEVAGAVVPAPETGAKALLAENQTFINNLGGKTSLQGGKLQVAFELGQGGAPGTRSEFYRLLALNDMKGGFFSNTDKILDPVEQAKVLNVGANLKALAGGHSVGEVDASTFKQYASVAGGKITITDWKGFQDNVLDKLEAHAGTKFDGLHGQQAMRAARAGKVNAFNYVDQVGWKKDLRVVGYDQPSARVQRGHFPAPAELDSRVPVGSLPPNQDYTLDPFHKVGGQAAAVPHAGKDLFLTKEWQDWAKAGGTGPKPTGVAFRGDGGGTGLEAPGNLRVQQDFVSWAHGQVVRDDSHAGFWLRDLPPGQRAILSSRLIDDFVEDYTAKIGSGKIDPIDMRNQFVHYVHRETGKLAPVPTSNTDWSAVFSAGGKKGSGAGMTEAAATGRAQKVVPEPSAPTAKSETTVPTSAVETATGASGGTATPDKPLVFAPAHGGAQKASFISEGQTRPHDVTFKDIYIITNVDQKGGTFTCRLPGESAGKYSQFSLGRDGETYLIRGGIDSGGKQVFEYFKVQKGGDLTPATAEAIGEAAPQPTADAATPDKSAMDTGYGGKLKPMM